LGLLTGDCAWQELSRLAEYPIDQCKPTGHFCSICPGKLFEQYSEPVWSVWIFTEPRRHLDEE
jgi:hypothetical protein